MPLGKRTDYGDAKYAGTEPASVTDLVTTLRASRVRGAPFVSRMKYREHCAGLPTVRLRLHRRALGSTCWSAAGGANAAR